MPELYLLSACLAVDIWVQQNKQSFLRKSIGYMEFSVKSIMYFIISGKFYAITLIASFISFISILYIIKTTHFFFSGEPTVRHLPAHHCLQLFYFKKQPADSSSQKMNMLHVPENSSK